MVKKKRREIEVVVLSDIHLGTFGCHAAELNKYLKSIDPKILVLNGDIIDIWQFNKRYWPNSHMKVVKQIIRMISNGTQTYYITGNHDEMLRRFEGLKIGNIEILNKLELELNGEKALFFHGDIFDVIIQHSKWLAKLGAIGYDSLILLNTFVNYISKVLGKGKVSLSKTIKDNVKSALKYINDFETSAANLACKKGFNYIVCGHIHQVQDRIINTQYGDIRYLNSGDWIENLTSLEYNNNEWKVYQYSETENIFEDQEPEIDDLTNKKIFEMVLNQFKN